MVHSGREPLLRATWLAALAALYALLTLAPALAIASPLERALFAPAAFAMELAARSGGVDAALFPIYAALQLLALGLLLDAPRLLRAARGRAASAPLEDPLRPWKLTLAVALVAVGGWYVHKRDAERPFYLLDVEAGMTKVSGRAGDLDQRLARALEDAREGRRIVLVGDSMMNAALVGDRALEAGLRRAGEPPVKLARLTVGGLELVELRPLLADVLALEPALVVLDANVLFSKVGNAFVLRSYGRPARWANDALDRLERVGRELGLARPAAGQYAPGQLAGHGGEARPELEAELQDRWAGRRASAHDPNYLFAAELLAELRRRGVPVAITTVPVSAALTPKVDAFLEDAHALVATLAERADVPLLESERYAPDDWFLDTVHMNATGQPRYSAWLVRELRALDSGG